MWPEASHLPGPPCSHPEPSPDDDWGKRKQAHKLLHTIVSGGGKCLLGPVVAGPYSDIPAGFTRHSISMTVRSNPREPLGLLLLPGPVLGDRVPRDNVSSFNSSRGL